MLTFTLTSEDTASLGTFFGTGIVTMRITHVCTDFEHESGGDGLEGFGYFAAHLRGELYDDTTLITTTSVQFPDLLTLTVVKGFMDTSDFTGAALFAASLTEVPGIESTDFTAASMFLNMEFELLSSTILQGTIGGNFDVSGGVSVSASADDRPFSLEFGEGCDT